MLIAETVACFNLNNPKYGWWSKFIDNKHWNEDLKCIKFWSEMFHDHKMHNFRSERWVSEITVKRLNWRLTSIMWPVEMSMLEWAGSSLQEEMLPRPEGLTAGPPSLNWDETLLILEEMGSGRSTEGLTDMRCRHSSCRAEDMDSSITAHLDGKQVLKRRDVELYKTQQILFTT